VQAVTGASDRTINHAQHNLQQSFYLSVIGHHALQLWTLLLAVPSYLVDLCFSHGANACNNPESACALCHTVSSLPLLHSRSGGVLRCCGVPLLHSRSGGVLRCCGGMAPKRILSTSALHRARRLASGLHRGKSPSIHRLALILHQATVMCPKATRCDP
jgi:hypothetical protein